VRFGSRATNQGVDFHLTLLKANNSPVPVTQPAGLWVTSLLEIPLKAKCDFSKSLKGQFFLTGRFSTFIVGKEVNDYIIFRNGSNGTMQATYNENQSYLAAVIDVSIGYEKFYKNKQTLRIEPWIQIERKGIGVGQLPVSGFGMQAGYFFHK